MNFERVVEVPRHCKAVFMSEQVLEQYRDWTDLSLRADQGVLYTVQMLAKDTNDPLVADLSFRYVEDDR